MPGDEGDGTMPDRVVFDDDYVGAFPTMAPVEALATDAENPEETGATAVFIGMTTEELDAGANYSQVVASVSARARALSLSLSSFPFSFGFACFAILPRAAHDAHAISGRCCSRNYPPHILKVPQVELPLAPEEMDEAGAVGADEYGVGAGGGVGDYYYYTPGGNADRGAALEGEATIAERAAWATVPGTSAVGDGGNVDDDDDDDDVYMGAQMVTLNTGLQPQQLQQLAVKERKQHEADERFGATSSSSTDSRAMMIVMVVPVGCVLATLYAVFVRRTKASSATRHPRKVDAGAVTTPLSASAIANPTAPPDRSWRVSSALL
jgi:hypothetical protein